jgi:Bifunctional DNA primase/polymerase, N-terminal
VTSTLLDAPASGNAMADLDVARRLVAMGVPVFRAQLSPDGSPLRPGWQFIEPDIAEVEHWRPGLALCATGGIVFDVLDVDPRHGGIVSLGRLLAELGDNQPEVYAKVQTPSGGWHYWIAALGIGKHVNFGRHSFGGGLDLQGGRPNGGSRGLAFLPPTIRPSKVTDEPLPYRWIEAPSQAPSGDASGAKLAGLIRVSTEAKPATPAGCNVTGLVGTVLGSPSGRMRGILAKVLEAEPGERNRLLFWGSCKAAEMVAAREVTAETAASFLAEAAERIGLPADEAARTIASAMRQVTA